MRERPIFSITEKNLKISYFSGTGAGGQHRNKHQNCVRMHHPESGVRATGQSYKSRKANKEEAFKSLAYNPLFRLWIEVRCEEIRTGETLMQIVDKMMRPENLKVECRIDGMWQVSPAGQIEETPAGDKAAGDKQERRYHDTCN